MVSLVPFYRSLKQITVEPIIFLIYLGWVFGNTLQSPGLYQKVCRLYYGDNVNVSCKNLVEHAIEDEVQAYNAQWSLYNAISYLLPAVFADTILGAYGDRYGRQVNILIGIAGIAVSEYGYMLTLSNSANTPYYTVLIFGVFTGATGYIALVPVSCNAYLADITVDKSQLTIRSGIFSVAQGLSSVLGGFFGGLFSDLSIPIAMDIELFMYVVAFFYVIWRIPQRPGIEELKRRARGPPATAPTVCSFLKEIWALLKQGFWTYCKPRLGHRRAFMFLTVFVLMLTYTTSVETRISSVMNFYAFRTTGYHALHWGSKELGFWNGSGYLLLIVGTLVGLYVGKKVLKLRETTLIIIGLLSSSARTLMIGLAAYDWQMYLANVLGCLAGISQPAIISFMVQLVEQEEIGRAFSLFGIAADLAFIVTNLIYNNIYSATVASFPGFLFILIAFIQTCVAGAMVWVHFQSIREGIGAQAIDNFDAHDERDSQLAVESNC